MMYAQAMTTATPQRTNPNHVVRKLMALLELSHARVADRTGLSRQAIHNRVSKGSEIPASELTLMASALRPSMSDEPVPVELLLGSAVDAIRWVLDNRPEWFTGNNDQGGLTAANSAQFKCTERSRPHLTTCRTSTLRHPRHPRHPRRQGSRTAAARRAQIGACP